MHEVKPVTSGYRVSLTFHLWLSDVHGQIPRPLNKSRTSTSLLARDEGFDGCRDMEELGKVVGRVLLYWLEKNEYARNVIFIVVLDHLYPSGYNRNKTNLHGRDHLLLKAIESFSDDLKVCSQTLTVDKMDGPYNKPGQNLDRIHIPVVFGDGEYHTTEPGEGQDPEYFIWLNRYKFLTLDHDIFSYKYDTGNEGYDVSLAYQAHCITINHPDYSDEPKKEFYVGDDWY